MKMIYYILDPGNPTKSCKSTGLPWDRAKVVLREKFILMSAYIKN
jgi:hypothetical protein